MIWHDHSRLSGSHSLLSPSSGSWVNYTPEKLVQFYINQQRKAMGTKLHALAETCIKLSQRLPDNNSTMSRFVNDALGYRMNPEQTLYYSPNFFGTADAISFDLASRVLRIHDLKTGVTPGKLIQLEIYAALFFLEYGLKPGDSFSIILRIYQNDEIVEWEPDPTDIMRIMGTIVAHDKILEEIQNQKG